MAMRTVLLSIFLLTILQTSLGNSEGMIFPHTSASFADTLEPASAQAMLNDLETKVMQFITQRDGNDTATAEGFLSELAAAAASVKASKEAVDAPDALWDSCLLQENASLHAWKVCNDTLASETGTRNVECNHNEGVGSYTIDSYTDSKFSYKLEGFATPAATCNFETFTIDGTTVPCSAFVDDIVTQAKEDFSAEYDDYVREKGECDNHVVKVDSRTTECAQLASAYFDKETDCIGKETALTNEICKFQVQLVSKCTTLGLLDTELEELNEVLEVRNKEYRSVMRLKCLFERYTKNDTCFDTSADTTCKLEINGATTTYSTSAARELHGFRTQRDGNNTNLGFECAPSSMSITFGDSKRYEKSDSSDAYSYYKAVDAKIYTTSSTTAWVFDGAVCSR